MAPATSGGALLPGRHRLCQCVRLPSLQPFPNRSESPHALAEPVAPDGGKAWSHVNQCHRPTVAATTAGGYDRGVRPRHPVRPPTMLTRLTAASAVVVALFVAADPVKDARERYDRDVTAARDDYDRTVTTAHERHVAELEKEQTIATRRSDLDTALAVRKHLIAVRAAGPATSGGGAKSDDAVTLARLAGAWDVPWDNGAQMRMVISPQGPAAVYRGRAARLVVSGANVLIDPDGPGGYVNRLTPTADGRVLAEEWKTQNAVESHPPQHHGAGTRDDG